MALIEIENLNFTYPKQTKKALDQIDLRVEEGEFLLLCGASGSGKSTLLRQIKREITPFGKKSGRILYDGNPLEALGERVSAGEIGFVMQNPENQVVTDQVWHELAFGLESLGLATPVIRRRVAEMASFFGIQDWFEKRVTELSGGQMQMLNLASVMAMQPRVLILDEPTSQLDPIAAADFLETVGKINRELSVTVLLSEHRLEEVFPIADRVAVMEDGGILCCDTPAKVARTLSADGQAHPMSAGLPAAARIFAGAGGSGVCPLTVREGRRWLREHFQPDGGAANRAPDGAAVPAKPAGSAKPAMPARPVKPQGEPAAELRDVWFRYGKALPDVLKGVSLRLYAGQTACLLGGNGTGKTTALGVLAGVNRAYRGSVRLLGKKLADGKPGGLYRGGVGLLPQNPRLLFVRDTVREDLEELAGESGGEERLGQITREMELEELLDRHPYDLSGGEQQKAAFAKLLLRDPKVILLDEPTKGLDAPFKIAFAGILKRLAQRGAAILMATHDVEFAAAYADDCLLFFNGAVVSQDAPGPFFSGNSFYTTAADRIARRTFPGAITCGEVIARCASGSNPSASKPRPS